MFSMHYAMFVFIIASIAIFALVITTYIFEHSKNKQSNTTSELKEWEKEINTSGVCKIEPNGHISKLGGIPPHNAEFQIGQCVIVRGNNYEENLQTAIVVGYFSQFKSARPIPFVINQSGELGLCMAITVPYSDMLWNMLTKMENKEQWDFLLEMQWGTRFEKQLYA